MGWYEDYRESLKDLKEKGELEWRLDFYNFIVRGGLEYSARQIAFERKRTDLRVFTENGISHLVFETKIKDSDLNQKKTLDQAREYLRGSEAFVILASPIRIRIYTPDGKHQKDLDLRNSKFKTSSAFWKLSKVALDKREHMTDFRAGRMACGYLPVDNRHRRNLDKLIEDLRLSSDILIEYVRYAWDIYQKEYATYKEKLKKLEYQRGQAKATLKTATFEQINKQFIREEMKLKRRYKVAIEIQENSYPVFKAIQPFSRDVSGAEEKREREFQEVYFTDVAYAALNRILFVRIAEDKKLVTRKLSNGGIRAWRDFVENLKNRYQDLLGLAYKDTAELYRHFFEPGIFDWTLEADARLHEALEDVFYVLNGFDFSKIDSNTLADLYQEYLPPDKRKKLGEFYTPQEVAEFIIRESGYPSGGRLLDFACGSGGFIVPAARMRMQQLEKKGVSPALRLEALKEIIGLDINPFATHIAEMNLLFLILDNYLESKKKDKSFRLPGLPIYTTDSLVGDPERHLPADLLSKVRQMEDIVEALEIVDERENFDYVVGNPPYVRNERLPEGIREIYASEFEDVAHGNTDIFVYFLRKGVNWLKPGGVMGVIVSLGLADAEATRKLREFLGKFKILSIVPLEWTKVFVANVNPMLLFLKKELVDGSHQVKLVHNIQDLSELKKGGGKEDWVNQKEWLGLTGDLDQSWRVEVTQRDIEILRKLKTQPKIFSASYGLALRDKAGGRELISEKKEDLENPYPLLDGREVKAWSVEWQGRYLDFQPDLISDPKPPEFFKPPVIFVPRISLTVQACAMLKNQDSRPFMCRNTVMVVNTGDENLKNTLGAASAILNSVVSRYYAFLMLRAGVMEGSHRSTFYVRVIEGLPVADRIRKESKIIDKMEQHADNIQSISDDLLKGDKKILVEVEELVGQETMPFALTPNADLKPYVTAFDMETSFVDDPGVLREEGKLGNVKGEPEYLEYILSMARLEGEEELSKTKIEKFPVPKNLELCRKALEIIDGWLEKKPTLAGELRAKEEEINALCLDAFDILTEQEKKYILTRASSFPMDRILVTPLPGAPTKKIAYRRWKAGERYR